ncbi:hypothetical protein GALL_440600 [mine drainage metagenome]|uniref:Uncharacterized protein n=1 Tax=mine drainage metagenome TaxID=410659 RepID=A0A1J5PRQ6_9ZZZZ
MIFCGLAANLRVCSSTQAARQLTTDIKFHVGIAHEQRLRIGIDGNELNAFESNFNHPINRIDSAAADTDDFDNS